MKTVRLDRILTSAPINKAAAVARDGRGVHWAPEQDIPNVRFDAPPILLPVSREHKLNAEFNDLTGKRFGRFVVLGRVDREAAGLPPRENVGALWAVRCACGAYEYRARQKLQKPRGEPMCSHCNYVEELKAGRVHGVRTIAERRS